MRALLARGVDVHARDENGRTALHLATMVNNLEIVEMLLVAGAKADATDDCNDVPLHFAAQHPSRLAVLERLLAAAPHAVHQAGTGDVGRFPLHVAVDAKWRDGIVRLLACGADPRKPDASGRSALDVAPNATIRALLEGRAQSRRATSRKPARRLK